MSVETQVEPELTNNGHCNMCGQTFAKNKMSRHLSGCTAWKQHPDLLGTGSLETGSLMHLIIEDRDSPLYWLHLEIPSRATLLELDQFLRDYWLECCDHLSAFEIGNTHYQAEPFDDEDEEMQEARLEDLRENKKPWAYKYDFGSTTELKIRNLGERAGRYPAHQTRIRILAQNDAPAIPCDECGTGLAANICTDCSWDEGGWLCDKCAKKHKIHPGGFLPVVNSPRVGVCGYEGPIESSLAKILIQ